MLQNSPHALAPAVPVSARPGSPVWVSCRSNSVIFLRQIPYLIVGASLIALVWFSLRLAAGRIFQVDECVNVFAAHAIAAGQTHLLGAIDLFQIPLAWLARGNTRAIDIYIAARFVMVEIFWLNFVLIAAATGQKLFSRRGLLALAGAATLAPMWDYGFEIRQENLLLPGVLLMWCCARPGKLSIQGCIAVGMLSIALPFVALKALVYTVPIAAGMLLFGKTPQGVARWKFFAVFVLGALIAFCAVRLVYGYWGVWEATCKDGVRWGMGESTGDSHRFAPWLILQRLLAQTPLLLAISSAAAIYLLRHIRKARAFPFWDRALPESLVVIIGLAALAVNPAPQNLILLVPFLYLFAFRHIKMIFEGRSENDASKGVATMGQFAVVPLVAGSVIFIHLVPFGSAAIRHLQFPNTRQDVLMALTEKFTDPAKDPVCDGIGMVSTRPVVDPRTNLGTSSFLNDTHLPSCELMLSNTAAVFIPNYRTDALSRDAQARVREHYVSLADDFWVLGKVLPLGGGRFEIIHPGRYRVSTLTGSDLAGTYPEGIKGLLTPPEDGNLAGVLDGRDISGQVLELAVGIHQFTCASNMQPAVVWLGPRLDRPQRVSPADHQTLFVSWY